MTFRPYLAFSGNCREAFSRYQEIFGGELAVLAMSDMPADAGGPPPGANPDAVMHAALTSSIGVLMGADDPFGGFDGHVHGMCVNCEVDDVAESERIFNALSEGGEVQMPLASSFFSPSFGMCTDRFGTPWMVFVDAEQS